MASAPFDYEQVAPETVYPPAPAFSWPHGIMVSLRMICMLGAFFSRFFLFVLPVLELPFTPPMRIPYLTVGDYFSLFIFFGLGCVESVYTFVHHLNKGTFWSFSLLFYPIYIFIYLFAAINASNVIGLFSLTFTTLGSLLVHGQMVFSILILLLCPIHYCLYRTWVLAIFSLKYVFAKIRTAIQQHQAGNGGLGGANQ